MTPQDCPTRRPPAYAATAWQVAGPPIEPPKQWRRTQIRRITPIVELVAVNTHDARLER